MSASHDPEWSLEVEKIVVPEVVSQTPALENEDTRAEKRFLLTEQALKLRELEQNIDARKCYAFRLFVLICVWLLSILGILIATGFDHCPFHLSDAVLLGLIGGTTATVLGLFLVVVKYLFPSG